MQKKLENECFVELSPSSTILHKNKAPIGKNDMKTILPQKYTYRVLQTITYETYTFI